MNDLQNVQWGALIHNDLNTTVNISDNINNIIDKHARMKLASNRKKKQIQKPWLTKGILKSIRAKHKLFNDFMKDPHDNDKKYIYI